MQNIVIQRYARVDGFLPKVMKLNRKTTTELGTEIGYTQSMVSKLRTGVASLNYDQVGMLMDQLPEQNELLQLEIAHQLFPIIPPVADGDRFIGKDSLHASDRSLTELKEAIEALKQSHDEFMNGNYSEIADPKKAVNETLDAVFIAMNMLVTVCHEFKFSLAGMLRERIKLWRMNKLVR